MNIRKRGIELLCMIAVICMITGCSHKKKETVCIAEQFGIAYAPLNIMKELGILEEKLPSVSIEWKQFGGPTAIREAMLSKEVDFGFMGICPVLVGIDNGMEWRYATGLSFNEVAIVTNKQEINSLADIQNNDKIAILSPACTQHVLLCMLAEEELSDAHIFDGQLVSLSHPDAVSALLAGTEVSVHVTTPPYIEEEIKNGAHIIATGEEIMGEPFTFISGVAMESFYEENKEYYDAFIEALDEAIDYINDHMEEAVKILAPIYGITEEELYEQMTYQGTIYSNRLIGIEKMSQAMYEMGFIKNELQLKDIVFDNALEEKEHGTGNKDE